MANRRKFLAGLGALASGSAAAVGTGAFTSVSADRDITVNTTGDGSALLKFEKATNDTNDDGDGDTVTQNARAYVDLSGGSEVSFNFNQGDTVNGANSSGINQDATTIFDDLIDIVNQGSQEVLVGVSDSPSGISVYSEGDDAASDAATQGDATAMNTENYTESEQKLEPGERLKNIGIYVTDASAADGGSTITFSAEAINNND